MSEPRQKLAEWLTRFAAEYANEWADGEWGNETQLLRACANELRGQSPSDGMPSEPSEEAVAAFLEFTDADRPDPGTHREWSIPDDVDNHLRAALRAAYAAERGEGHPK